MTPEELLAQNFPTYLKRTSLLEIETLLRCLATELAARTMPDVSKLWAYAALIERYRLAVRTSRNAH